MKVSDIMTRGVVSVRKDATIMEAIRLMLQHKISGLVVLDDKDRLAGVVTEGDFLRRREVGTQKQRSRWIQFLMGPGKLADEYVHNSGRKVAEVMTTTVQSVTEETSLAEAVELMERHRIKRLPVVRGDLVVGIVSRANFLHALAGVAHEIAAPAADDAGIREKILAEIDVQKWALPGMANVSVRNGVVEFWGVITDERMRGALIVAAENVSGVKAVKDHLAWIEPMSGVVISPDEEPAPRANAI